MPEQQNTATTQQPEQQHWSVAKAFSEGGPAMYGIAIIGILTIAIVIGRLQALGRLVINKQQFNETLFGMIVSGQLRQAITFCDSRLTPLTSTLKAGLIQALNKRSDEEIQVAMDAVVLRETPKLEGWVGFLAVFGNLATLTGLLGTVSGMITSFQSVYQEKDAVKKAELLSRGIAEALNCTAFGLLVAILAILSYGYFQMKISRATNDMIESSMSLMNLVASNRDKIRD